MMKLRSITVTYDRVMEMGGRRAGQLIDWIDATWPDGWEAEYFHDRLVCRRVVL